MSFSIRTAAARFLTIFVAVLLITVAVSAQGSSFTFQGKLNDAGVPATGTFEMQFKLMDNLGTQIGSIVTNNNVAVTNGVFSVRLSFGLLAFNGDPRFLEISVRPAGSSNPFTTLNPPQSVLSAPYAVRSLTSGTADLATSATNSAQLGGIDASQYVQTTDSRLSDNRSPLPGSGNYIQNSTATQASSDFSISGTGRAGLFSSTTQYNVGNSRLIGINGTSNLFAGVNSGTNTTGTGNAFFGGLSGQNTTTGVNNAFFGFNAGSANNGGGANTFIGVNAGLGNVGSSNNTFLGANAGNSNLTSNGNTYLGANSDGALLVTNSVAIGQKAFVGQSNALILGSINGVNTATADTDVGIGTPNPLARFHVVGDSALVGDVGIGTSSPTARLTVKDDSATNINLVVEGNFAGGTGIQLRNTASGGKTWNLFANNGVNSCCTLHLIDFQGEEVMAFGDNGLGNGNGYVSVNGTFEATGLMKVGTLSSSGSSSLCISAAGFLANCSSSVRYKTDLATFSSGLSILKRLRPVTFRWKSDNAPDLGFVAEEVAEVEPLLTTANKDGQVEGVKYDRITTVLVNSVKEQQLQIEAQRKEIDELKAIVCSLKPDATVCVPNK